MYVVTHFRSRPLSPRIRHRASVANGAIAWELLEDVNNSFDLVLTDVVMPCLSGVGMFSKMMTRELRKRIPVVSKLLILVPMNVICVLTHNSIIDSQLKPHYHEGAQFVDLGTYLPLLFLYTSI
jgi:response regulator of citrate/malate metabolism